MSTIWDISDDDFKIMVKSSNTYADVLRACGYTNMGNTKIVKKRIKLLELDVTHIANYKPVIGSKIALEDILVEQSTYNSTLLKQRLIDEYNWVYECSECKITKWNHKPITFDLDHINGIHSDNRIENLRLLCPNCHSQTSTYKSKFKKQVEKRKCADCYVNIYTANKSGYCAKCVGKYRGSMCANKPDHQTLEQDLLELKTNVAVGQKYSVSDYCIRTWIRKYRLEQKNTTPE